MPTLRFTTRVACPPGVVLDSFIRRTAFEALLPRYLARVRVTYPGEGAAVDVGTEVVFQPWLFPRRWRVRSLLASGPPGPLVWRWREGPLRGTETWRIEPEGQGTRFTREIVYLREHWRETLFWTFVGIPAHTLVAMLERRRLRRLCRRRHARAG